MSRRFGFTLIEAIISMAIMSIIVLAVVFMVGEVFKAQANTRAIFTLRDNISFAQARIRAKVGQAYDILSPVAGTLPALTLQMSPSAADTLAFTLADGRLYMSANNESPIWLTSQEVRLTTFGVTRLTGITPMVRVLIRGELRSATGTYQQNMEAEATYSINR